MGLNKYLLTVIICLGASLAFSQKNRYMVFFKDKAGTPFSVSSPADFLSPRAIERRLKHNVAISTDDLPVTPSYLQGVRDAGAEVYFPTRWMNGVLVQCEATLVPSIEALSFVRSVELVAPDASLIPSGRLRGPARNKGAKSEVTNAQLQLIGLDKMHAAGFRGQGVNVAILDAGFSGVNTASPFSHLFSDARIDLEASHDFVYNSSNVFQYDDHGTEVFSVIAAIDEGTFRGGAPDATFQLYVTEEVPTEYRVEEYNWLFAAERADSAGVDIIQSSLGYNDFDGTAFDYLKSQMDGKTAVVTKAAQWAADRGIVVVTSAGNEGSVSWQIITAPADGKDVLAVASVNAEGVRSNSSSVGPSSDNRIKPDVAALGVNTSVIEPSGSVGKSSGTSLAAPLITSLAAGILQKYPALTNIELVNAIRSSGSQAYNPDHFLGYGIPNYEQIVGLLDRTLKGDLFAVFPNPSFVDTLVVRPLYPDEVTSCRIEFISTDGRMLFTQEAGFSVESPSFSKSLPGLASGMYFVRISWKDKTYLYRFVKG